MPNAISEEPLEIEIAALEPGPPTAQSYPYPELRASGETMRSTFLAAVIENDYLRAAFVPGLGGRLLELFDKRTKTELLSRDSLRSACGGRRGQVLIAGIELHLDGDARLTSLGAVQHAAEEADEEGGGSLWLGEAVTGTGLSWHLRASMPEDRAELVLEARIFNRSFKRLPYRAGLLMPEMPEWRASAGAFFASAGGQGIGLLVDRAFVADRVEGMLRLARFPEPRPIAPHQLDTWTVRIVPISGLRGVSAVTEAGALFVGGESIQIQAAAPIRGKIVLMTRRGESLEAPTEIDPRRIAAIPLPEPVAGVAVMDEARNVVLRWEGDWAMAHETGQPRLPDRSALSQPATPYTDGELEQATFDVGRRHVAHALLGVRALAAGDFEAAEARFEQSLLNNGEDHLAWWMKAMAARLGSRTEGESPELLNAHFLAPLEPALRAESFLAQPQTLEEGSSPLLKPLDDFPDAFLEVAALLFEAGLHHEAARWIDEALRHADLPMLRYLLAYAHLKVTNLEFEAAEQVKAASTRPITPPFPWRGIEIEALRALSERFPDEPRIAQWLDLYASSQPK
ncbi:MAG TPA: hypothetical protein VMI31_04120 [Fimbriimonadaceae bacterium]|nr:hypothetical protein [Fimbriimonadaceae bacterium]